MSYFPPPAGSPSPFEHEPFGPLSRDDVTLTQPPVEPAPEPKRRGGGWRGVAAGGIAGALLGGAVAFVTVKVTDDDTTVVAPPAAVAEPNSAPANPGTATPQTTTAAAPAPAPSGSATGFDIQAVLAKVSPSVVSIETGVQGRNGIFANGAGSGVIISADGLILTNNHVIEGADRIQVKASDGKQYDATVVGAEPTRDIALVQTQGASGLTAATLGDTSTLKVGDTVVAIGNALNLGDTPTVTVGIVSAKSREINTDTETLQDLIQTDAAINPGNSGGALVNTAGQVVGINTAGVRGAQNISFAIDINGVKPLIEQLKSGKGTVTAQAFLGIGTANVADLDEATRQQLGLAGAQGIVITEVQPGSGAEQAGLRVGDLLQSIDGKPIQSADDVRGVITAKQPKEQLQVVVERGGTQVTVTATLGARAVTTG